LSRGAQSRLASFLGVSTQEFRGFARLTGNNDVHALSVSDLLTATSEVLSFTDIEHA